MKKLLSLILALFPLAVSGAIPILPPIRSGPLTTNTPAASTNVVRNIVSGAALNGAGFTNLNANNLGSGTLPDARFPAVLPAVDGSQLTGIGAASQTPWTQTINAAAKVLTNAGNIYQTNQAGVVQVTKRIGGATSHIYPALAFDLGGPTNDWFSLNISSHTNHYAAAPNQLFDHTFNFGINMPDGPEYNPWLATLGWGFEQGYTGPDTINRAESYLVFKGNQYNSHARAVGFSFFYDNATTNASVLMGLNVASLEVNSTNGLSALAMYQTSSNEVNLVLQQDSNLSYLGNTREDGKMIVGKAGDNLVGQYQWGMDAFGGSVASGSNAAIVLPGYSLGAYSPRLLFGSSNTYAGIGWHHTLAKMGAIELWTTGNAPVFRAFDSGVFTEPIFENGGGGTSNVFNHAIRMRNSAGIFLEGASGGLFLGLSGPGSTDRYQYIQAADTSGNANLYGAFVRHSFFTLTGTSGGGTERVRIDDLGLGALAGRFTNNLTVGGNQVTTGTNQAAYFVGDGSLLTGISGASDGSPGIVTNQFTVMPVGGSVTGAVVFSGQGLTLYGASGDPTFVMSGGTPAGTNVVTSDSGGVKIHFGGDLGDADLTVTEDTATAVTFVGALSGNAATATTATTATTANAGDSATAFFSSGTLEDARLSANVSLLGQTIVPGEIDLAALNDTELLYNNAGAIGTLPQSTFLTPAGSAAALTIDASGFNGVLATTDNTLPEIAQKLDDLSLGGGSNPGIIYYAGTQVMASNNVVVTNLSAISASFETLNTISFYPTNLYTGVTNKVLLTDGNGKLTSDAGLTYNATTDALSVASNITANLSGFNATLQGYPTLETTYAGLWIAEVPDLINYSVVGNNAGLLLVNASNQLSFRIENNSKMEVQANSIGLTVGLYPTNGVYSRSNTLFYFPTNAPTAGQILTASATTGVTRWSTGGGSVLSPIQDSGATDRFSFVDNSATLVLDENGGTAFSANAAAGETTIQPPSGDARINLTATLMHAISADAEIDGDLQVDGGLLARTNTAQFDVNTANFVIGTRYTNSVRRSFVTASFTLSAAAAGTAAVSLRCEQAGVTNRVNISAGPLASLSTVEQLSLMVGPGAFYYFSDDTSGTGASASIVAGTSSRTDL